MTTPDPKVLEDVRAMIAEAKPETTQRLLEDIRKLARTAEGKPVYDA